MIDHVIEKIRETLSNNGVDYQGLIDQFGQVSAYEDRQSGKTFTLNDHVRALVLSQLSNQRPWGPIAANLNRIQQIFAKYDSGILKKTNPDDLVLKLRVIRCGNRKISAQMNALSENIELFESIAKEFGSMDAFVTSTSAENVAKELGAGKKYKLREIGFTLAMEYLRNVGINAVKPDVHICRLIGPERLGFTDHVPTPEEAYLCLMDLVNKSAENAVYIDNLLWIFAARDYGNICTANPRCNKCNVTQCAMHPSTRNQLLTTRARSEGFPPATTATTATPSPSDDLTLKSERSGADLRVRAMVYARVRGLSRFYADGTEVMEIHIPKDEAGPLPNQDGERILVQLEIEERQYRGGIRSTERNPYVWICPDVEDTVTGATKLGYLLPRLGFRKNERVGLSVEGVRISVNRLGDPERLVQQEQQEQDGTYDV